MMQRREIMWKGSGESCRGRGEDEESGEEC